MNAKVNRFSRISEVVEEKDDFVKTPTHKIKRFLYSKKKESGTPGSTLPDGPKPNRGFGYCRIENTALFGVWD